MLIRTVRHRDWNHKQLTLYNITIAECALIASHRFDDPGPWIITDEHCTHELSCERVTEWRVVNLRGSAEGE